MRRAPTSAPPTRPARSPQLDASDPSLPALLEASRSATVVGFDYLKAGAGEPQRRTLEPWGVLSWRRRWYVAGLDRDRGEPRSFRLSRIVGAVQPVGRAGAYERPEHVSLLDLVAGRGPDEGLSARVRIDGSGAGQLRRIAQSELDGVLTISYTDTGWLARTVRRGGGERTRAGAV